MEEIIIQKINKNILVYVLENGDIVEKYEFDVNNGSTIGNIYVGTVKEIFNGMQAAFVDIGLEKNAFLPLKDVLPKVDVTQEQFSNNAETKLSKVLKKNERLLLQVRKEAFEEKGPRVSTHITLAGNYLVIMPETDIITVSQKIGDLNEKNRLVEIIKSKLPENYGCIIRTDAEGIEKQELLDDMEKILNLWFEIKLRYESVKDSKSGEKILVYNDNDVATKVARDMVRKSTKKIYVNDNEIYEKLKVLVNKELIDYKKNTIFVEEFGLQNQVEKACNRKIWLKCGAHIVIDKTEALTAIDVNSSRCTGDENLEKTIFKINKEAAIEIMKQVRLKDIGGIIVIDFIDMHNEEYKNEILKIMKEEQKKDRSKIEIKEFTQLNLVEMTRKKMYV